MLTEELQRAGFAIREQRGVCRGIYGPAHTAREAFMAVCTAAAGGDA